MYFILFFYFKNSSALLSSNATSVVMSFRIIEDYDVVVGIGNQSIDFIEMMTSQLSSALGVSPLLVQNVALSRGTTYLFYRSNNLRVPINSY